MITKDSSMLSCDLLIFGMIWSVCNQFARWLHSIYRTPCSATPPSFWQTRLFTNSSNISTTICGSQFLGIREKAGLSKWGRSGTRLHKTGFRARMNEIKIGDSVLWQHVLVFLDALLFRNNFARWLQKIVATCDSRCEWCRWCDVLVFLDAMIFCNNFARWLQKIVATCVGFSVMLWPFLNNFARWLQKIVATCDAICWVFLGCYYLL